MKILPTYLCLSSHTYIIPCPIKYILFALAFKKHYSSVNFNVLYRDSPILFRLDHPSSLVEWISCLTKATYNAANEPNLRNPVIRAPR